MNSRDFSLLRSWFFVPGADRQAIATAPASGADAIVQELEDFTPRHLRGQAHSLVQDALNIWRSSEVLAAVRINPLDDGGALDLRAVMPARPEVVMMSKVTDPSQAVELDQLLTEIEGDLGLPIGATVFIPNIETASGLVHSGAIAQASPRIKAMLVATEDMVVDLGADRTRLGTELLYPRSRFLLECRAVGVAAIDCPYTFSDPDGAERDMDVCRSIGYKSKAVVHAPHVAVTNAMLTPSIEAVAAARRQVLAYETAEREGRAQADVDGQLVEIPSYLSAKRLLVRYGALQSIVHAQRD